MRYNFLLKWGGNPSNMETIADPTAQPTGPDPNQLLLPNEIISPENTIANYIYKWDTRRDLLTQAATKRIKECQIYDSTLFTDGKQCVLLNVLISSLSWWYGPCPFTKLSLKIMYAGYCGPENFLVLITSIPFSI